MHALSGVLNKFETLIIQPAMAMIFAAGLFLFTWGLMQFLWNLDEGGAQTEGKWHMVYGLLGMFIMVSIWGILNIATATFGFSANPANNTNMYDPARANSISTGFKFQ